MRSRFIIGVLAVVGLCSASGLASRGDAAGPARRWAIVNFTSPVQLNDQFLMGRYLIVHDDDLMAKGEACTHIYRFDSARGPREEVLSFHCVPTPRDVCAETTFKVRNRGADVPKLLEYQFAGDAEGHGVPLQ